MKKNILFLLLSLICAICFFSSCSGRNYNTMPRFSPSATPVIQVKQNSHAEKYVEAESPAPSEEAAAVYSFEALRQAAIDTIGDGDDIRSQAARLLINYDKDTIIISSFVSFYHPANLDMSSDDVGNTVSPSEGQLTSEKYLRSH